MIIPTLEIFSGQTLTWKLNELIESICLAGINWHLLLFSTAWLWWSLQSPCNVFQISSSLELQLGTITGPPQVYQKSDCKKENHHFPLETPRANGPEKFQQKKPNAHSHTQMYVHTLNKERGRLWETKYHIISMTFWTLQLPWDGFQDGVTKCSTEITKFSIVMVAIKF